MAQSISKFMSHTTNTLLEAEAREHAGTAHSKRLRANHQLPAIIFGNNKASVAICLPEKNTELLHRNKKLLGHIVDINLNGKKEAVLVRSVQKHPLKDSVLHIDMERISKTKKITTDLAIEYRGEQHAPAAKEGGQIIHFISSISIECLPDDLPDHIIIDVSKLTLDQTLHFSDLTLPKGVSLSQTVDETHNPPVCVFHLPKIQEDSDVNEPITDTNTTEETGDTLDNEQASDEEDHAQ
jgi:large subunit ribosomal protein L25